MLSLLAAAPGELGRATVLQSIDDSLFELERQLDDLTPSRLERKPFKMKAVIQHVVAFNPASSPRVLRRTEGFIDAMMLKLSELRKTMDLRALVSWEGMPPGLADDTHPVACKTVLATVHGAGAHAGKTHAQRKASLAGTMTKSLWGDGVTPGDYDIMLWSGFDVAKEHEVEKLAQYAKDHKAVEMSFTQATRGIGQCHVDGKADGFDGATAPFNPPKCSGGAKPPACVEDPEPNGFLNSWYAWNHVMRPAWALNSEAFVQAWVNAGGGKLYIFMGTGFKPGSIMLANELPILRHHADAITKVHIECSYTIKKDSKAAAAFIAAANFLMDGDKVESCRCPFLHDIKAYKEKCADTAWDEELEELRSRGVVSKRIAALETKV